MKPLFDFHFSVGPKLGLLAALLCCGAAVLPSSASSQPAEDRPCDMAGGLQGRIDSIEPSGDTIVPGRRSGPLAAKLWRNSNGYDVPRGCFLRAGDKIVAEAGTKVTITLANGSSATALVGSPVTLPPARLSGSFDRIFPMLDDLMGRNGLAARNVAYAREGGTRGLELDDQTDGPNTPPYFQGIDAGYDQLVEFSRPLYVRWRGGAGPFSVSIFSAGDRDNPVADPQTTQSRDVKMDVKGLHDGSYKVVVRDHNGQTISLGIKLVASTAVPPAPQLDAAGDDAESRDLLQSMWLLTRGPSQWRLDAISRLEVLAVADNNIVAASVVDP